MLPIVLDPSKVRCGIAGHGEAANRRVAMLAASGVTPRRVENEIDVSAVDVLFVAGVEPKVARGFADQARALGVLVNVEDVPELCDFHVPAAVRRGDLLLTASTNGRAPGLARAVRAKLERLFGEEWKGRTDEIARLRERWRGEGLAPNEISARIDDHVTNREWMA